MTRPALRRWLAVTLAVLSWLTLLGLTLVAGALVGAWVGAR